MQRNKDQISRWSVYAPFREKHHGIIRRMFAPITQALVEDGQIGSGHTVLDVATGSGEPALSVAALVGPEGRVVGVDPILEMVAAARGGSREYLGFTRPADYFAGRVWQAYNNPPYQCP